MDLSYYIENALAFYTQDEYIEVSIKARKFFFELTGRIAEAEENFETKMDLFNDWYLFHFIPSRSNQTLIKSYLEKTQLEDEKALSLININYSLFEFIKIKKNFGILKDLLHSKKIYLRTQAKDFSFMEGEVLVGRSYSYEKEDFFLKGLWVVPAESKKLIKKEAKKIKKLKNQEEEKKFLLKIEKCLTTQLHFKHVPLTQIFQF